MEPIIFEQHPSFLADLAEAEKAEAEVRELPYFDLPIEICGVTVKQFTPRLFVTLCAANSPFLCGGNPEPEDAALFLWAVSDKFTTDRKARGRFIKSIAKLDYLESVRGIRSYIDAALYDQSGGESGGGKSSPITSFAASIVHEIATAYGWSRNAIMDTPFSELFQYIRLITRDEYARAGKRYLAKSRAQLRVHRKWYEKLTKEAK